MTLILDIPTEVELELRQAAAARGLSVEDYAVQKLLFDEAKFETLLEEDPLEALDYLVALTPHATAPLADDAVAHSYADYHDEESA